MRASYPETRSDRASPLHRKTNKPEAEQECGGELATFALHAGKNIRWVSDQLGHADPAFTLRVYAHALREEETDLSFADFGDPRRPNTAQSEKSDFEESPKPF